MQKLTVHDFLTDRMFDFMANIERACEVAEIIRHVQTVADQLGISHFTFYTRDLDGAENVDGTFPAEWVARYREKSHALHDPVHRQLLKTPVPFNWNAFARESIASPAGQRVLDEASAFGLRQGFTIPVFDGARLGGLLSFAGPHVDDDPKMLMALTLIATYAFRKYNALRGVPRPRGVLLSAREVECLHWASNGKTDWEIGMILGVKECTVRSHLENARVKLNATNKVQAVAEALRMGLLAL